MVEEREPARWSSFEQREILFGASRFKGVDLLVVRAACTLDP